MASPSLQDRGQGLEELIFFYLRSRRPRRVLVLIDSRHGVMDMDQEVMTLLDETAVS